VTIWLDSGGGATRGAIASAKTDTTGLASFRLMLPATAADYYYTAEANQTPSVKSTFTEKAVIPPSSDSGIFISARFGLTFAGYAGEAVAHTTVYVGDMAFRPLPGMTATLSVSSGTLSDTLVTTDNSGEASVHQWTLGPNIGADTLTIHVRSLSKTVVLPVLSGPPAVMVVDSTILQGAPDSLVHGTVRLTVVDAQGRGVPEVPVTFEDGSGASVCLPYTSTDDGGVLKMGGTLCSWRLGPELGPQTLRVSSGAATARITATAVARPAALTVVSNPATGGVTAGTTLADDVVVQVQPQPGMSPAGYLVRFGPGAWVTSGASAYGDSAVTDTAGLARVRWKLSATLGTQVLTAAIAAYPAVNVADTALVSGQPVYVTVSAAAAHTCAVSGVSYDGAGGHQPVFCWGRNAEQELDDGTTVERMAPVIATIPDYAFYGIALTAGGASSCAEYDDMQLQGVVGSHEVFPELYVSHLRCWGGNASGQVGAAPSPGATPVDVGSYIGGASVSASHACAVHSVFAPADSIVCWGDNQYGELGDGTRTTRFTPAGVHGFVGTPSFVRAGDGFACGVNTSGQAFCWGHNSEGQLGDNTRVDRAIATPVATNIHFATGPKFSAGTAHVCGIGTDGHAYCWGRNAFGQLGDGTQTTRSGPVAVATSIGFVAIAAGGEHTCALAADSTAYCWGNDDHGQLGTGASGGIVGSPTAVIGGLKFRSISAGAAHTCGVTTDHHVFCWGSNSDGQLGDGTTTDRPMPVQVSDYRPVATAAASMNRMRKR
jgi:alpha-tubulin suppressor-like RCC1 family protein